MMKKYLSILVLVMNSISGFSQKKALDTAMFNHWAYVREPAISSDGKYAAYIIANGHSGLRVLEVKAVSGQWSRSLSNVSSYAFTDDGKRLLYQQHDTLTLYTLGSKQKEQLYGIKSFRLLENDHLNAVLLETADGGLSFRNLKDGRTASFKNIASYSYDKSLNTAVLLRNEGGLQSLSWLDLASFREKIIAAMRTIENIVLDKDGKQVAFVAFTDTGSVHEKGMYRYGLGDDRSQLLLTESSIKNSALTLSTIERFSVDGKRLFYKLKEKPCPPPAENAVQVDVWSYTDARLQSNQLKQPSSTVYMYVIELNNHKTLRLQYPNESFSFFNDSTDSLASVTYNEGTRGERNWNPAAQAKNYLINCYTGERTEINLQAKTISPDCKFIGGYDSMFNDYYVYDVNNKKVINLTACIPIPEFGLSGTRGLERYRFSFAGWYGNAHTLLLYDDFDIWKVDFEESARYENLTKGYGRIHNIVFRVEEEKIDDVFEINKVFLLTAFNRTSKENGFFRLSLHYGNLKEIYMGPYHFHNQANMSAYSFFPLKAKRKDIWIIRREQANQSPNYCLTKDFKVFQTISNVVPEKDINWMTSELINYKSMDGKSMQGVLYKPENFDSTRKYPLIIYYYERLSDNLNLYKRPDFTGDNINIPWMISRGYLVFTPDIYYTIGKPGESAYNSVVGAADYLSRLHFVDSAKIGLQGHSFGGYETNYIITRTSRFKAAVSASGVSDFVSGYGDLVGSGESKQFFYEIHQSRIGGSLWEKRELFIENSPIFYANKVMTPLLMMNNKQDESVNFSQGVELFTALRRLRKKVWMLQYDGEGHSITEKRNQVDYTLRMDQVFDHYLKGAPAPLWMIEGIAAKDKGLKTGLELDTLGRTPRPGLVTPEEQKKIDGYSKIPLGEKLRKMVEEE
jgi:dipeptidyl aminopeptidase/acylaminoacyl peptidase